MKTEDHLTQVGLLKSKPRLAWFLLQWVGDTSEAVSFPISRRDLAQYLGLTIETISRHTAEWKRQGVISESKNWLTISDRETLQQIANN
jgi:CRP-like cAMP-binding protein